MTISTRVPNKQPATHPAQKRIRAVSHVLDEAIRIPGTNIRFGLDPVFGILPVAGDTVAAVLSAYVIYEGYRVGAPASLLAKMAALVAVDTIIGSVPVLGTVFDAVWKANTWNVDMLSEYLETERESQ